MKINKIDRVKEVVEIENDSDETADISGWKLLDAEKFKHPNPKYRHVFVFPKGTIAKPRKVLRVHTYSGTNASSDIYQNRKAPIWNNKNDIAILLDNNGNPAATYPNQPLRAISGYVHKAGTEKGISGAAVSASLSANPNAPARSEKTDSSGFYLFSNLAPGKYTLVASKEGFVTSDATTVDVTKGDESQNFYLTPSSKEIKISVEKIEIIPEQPEWNKSYQVKVTFKNNSNDFYYFETMLKRKWPKDDNYSEVPGTQQSSKKTYEKNSTWEITFTAPKDGWMNWNWYSKDSLGYAKEEIISKKIQNQIWFKAIRDEDEPPFEDTKEFEVVVKVSKDKRDALLKHNKNINDMLIATAAAGAATVLAAALLNPLTWAAAVVAAATAVIEGFLAGVAKNKADEEENKMKDP